MNEGNLIVVEIEVLTADSGDDMGWDGVDHTSQGRDIFGGKFMTQRRGGSVTL